MKGNLLIMHGGAPTAVINASLFGVIEEARRQSSIDRILASDGGTGGFLAGKIIDLPDIPQEKHSKTQRRNLSGRILIF